MRHEILKFYEKKNLHLSKIINKRPHYLKREQILAGAEKYYYEQLNGNMVRDILIVRRIHQLAHCSDYEKFKQDNYLLQNYKKIKAELVQSRSNWRMAFFGLTALFILFGMGILTNVIY